MEIKAVLCYILFHLLFVTSSDSSVFSPLRPETNHEGAKVYLNLTMPSNRGSRYNNYFNPQCNRPEEEANIFHACNVSGSLDFPAKSAVCKCSQCDWNMLLKCHSDGAWYATEAGVCTANYNCHKKCNISELGEVKSPVRCGFGLIGKLQKIHECRCRTNCMKTEVTCDENEGWIIDTARCKELEINRKKEEGNLTISLRNGIYTYDCGPSLYLQGNLTNRCDDGLLDGQPPKCVLVAPVMLGNGVATDGLDESHTSEPSMSGLFVILIVLLVFVVVFLLTYIIYWRYREESKAWLMRKMRRRPLPRPPMQRPDTEDHYEYIDINAMNVGMQGEYSMPYSAVVRSGESSGSAVSRLEVGATLRDNSTASCNRKPDDPNLQNSVNDRSTCVSVANEFYGEQEEWREKSTNSNDLSKNQELKTIFVPNFDGASKNNTSPAPKKPARKNIQRKDASNESSSNSNITRKDVATSIFLPTENDSLINSNVTRKDVATSIMLPSTSNELKHETTTKCDVATSNDDSESYDVLNYTENDTRKDGNRIVIEPRKNPSVPFAVPLELIKFSDEFVAPMNEELNSDESVEDNNAVMNEPRTSLINPAKQLNSGESKNQGTSSSPPKNSEPELDSSATKQEGETPSVSINDGTSPSTSGRNLNPDNTNTLPADESVRSDEENVGNRISNDLFEATVHFPNMSLLNRTIFDPDDDMKGA